MIFVLASMLIAISGMAADATGDTYVTRDFNLKDFTGISANGIFDVQLTKSNTYKVSITLPKELEEYLDVRVSKDKLILSTKQVPLKLTKNFSKWTVTAKVEMPALYSLSLSGASKFECNDSFNLGDEEFKMEISGASKANGLEIYARELNMEIGGATVATVAGKFHKANIEMGGAAKCNFEIDADELDQELSGAAKAFHTGSFDKVDVEASGASVFTFEGEAGMIEIDGSGASKIKTTKGTANTIIAAISGAAYCEVNALDYLKVEAIGGSSLKYVDNDSMKLDIRSISRGSSVTKL